MEPCVTPRVTLTPIPPSLLADTTSSAGKDGGEEVANANTAMPPLHTARQHDNNNNKRSVSAKAQRRQPCVDVVELDEPSVYCPSIATDHAGPLTPRPLAVLRQSPTHEPRRRRSGGDRDRFQTRKITSWMTTTTSTTVSLPSATVAIRTVPSLPLGF
ncbi:hypothetical protein TcCL_NonESM03866 [Trypanosoma cruzi]|uniref:Uncharacterized protein n=1 Tax=Trypanosoma cruzi (strain CL Brener) TaxID=353153 RepID=Q4DRJ4_TRYCC|nr:uncharacterized protein Tc00.1047053507491.39 [Trypanosoma cruzi]EAN95147.1 hypothetical protein, conserved [Trypanosoma cruzi]RNC46307.1 hypothetical protein TcCL_NonESM03866 [Trypanosoma cruzi]|eukprot:XP_816998.1 hypothetical protein [Trypanosoma cruzi strain CL Brener]